MKNSYPIAGQALDTTPDIDFRSDTVTKPDPVMRQYMCQAAVGDDVYAEDPSIIELQNKVAELLNKEASLFVPSGTMSNLIAVLTHCQRGEEVLIGDQYHIFSHEAAGASALGGVAMHPLQTSAKGYLTAQQIKSAIKPDDSHCPITKLVCLENTVSGFIQPQSQIDEIIECSKAHQLNTHLDGARLMHAVVQSNQSAAQLCSGFDSVSLCLSKGLGAPAGSVLSGSFEFIKSATRLRKMLGGGMRQSGILAAAGIYALDNNVQQLRQSHQLTKYMAAELNNIEQLNINIEDVETNMLFIAFPNSQHQSQSLASHLLDFGICIGEAQISRVVLHLDISKEDVDFTLEKIRDYYSKD